MREILFRGYTTITTKLIKEVKTMTYYESIKQMTVEEMVVFIKKIALGLNVDWLKGSIQKWLEQEVKEDE